MNQFHQVISVFSFLAYHVMSLLTHQYHVTVLNENSHHPYLIFNLLIFIISSLMLSILLLKIGYRLQYLLVLNLHDHAQIHHHFDCLFFVFIIICSPFQFRSQLFCQMIFYNLIIVFYYLITNFKTLNLHYWN